MPHSHDDVGWLKTVDEYFTGSNQNTQVASVIDTIATVMQELISDHKKRFTQVEMKFFDMWWKYQSDEMKARVSKLVSDG